MGPADTAVFTTDEHSWTQRGMAATKEDKITTDYTRLRQGYGGQARWTPMGKGGGSRE